VTRSAVVSSAGLFREFHRLGALLRYVRMSVAAVVLAAGGGTRFERPEHKLLAGFRGRPLLWWSLAAATGACLDEVAVIVGAVDLGMAVPEGVIVIENPDWASGQASSLQAAVSWALGRRHEAVVMGWGTNPWCHRRHGRGGGLFEPDRGGYLRWPAPTSGPA